MAKRDRKDEAGRVASGKYCRGCEDYSSCQYSPSLAGRAARLEFLDTYGVPTLAFHEHKLELGRATSFVLVPGKRRQGSSETLGLEIASKTNPSKT